MRKENKRITMNFSHINIVKDTFRIISFCQTFSPTKRYSHLSAYNYLYINHNTRTNTCITKSSAYKLPLCGKNAGASTETTGINRAKTMTDDHHHQQVIDWQS